MIMKCPKCDSENVAPIYYGIQHDNNEIRELIDNNKIIYGGSIMLDDQPHEDYGCQECGYRWSLDLLPGMYIKKIRFKVEDFGLGTIDMKRRYVYEIYPDGRWIEYTYQGESNRYTYKDICVTKKENVLRLYNKYQKLFGVPLWKKNIMEAQVCDGYGYTLQITYKDGRKRVIEGDIGGGTIDGIMENYLKKIFARNYDD